MQGLIKKTKKKEFMQILQNRIYKGRSFFMDEIKDLKIRYSERTTYLLKIKDAISMGYPTIAFAFYERYVATQGLVIDQNLVQFEKQVVNLPNATLFLRKAFGEDLAVLQEKITDLGELYFLLNKAEFTREEIESVMIPKLENMDTKFSDFLGVCFIMSTCSANKVNTQIQYFSFEKITKELQGLVSNIMNKKFEQDGEYIYVFEDDFLEKAKKVFDYFGEGLKKWAFIDRKLKKTPSNERIQQILGKHKDKSLPQIILNFEDDSYENKKNLLTDLHNFYHYLTSAVGYVIGQKPDYQFEYN